MIKQLSINGKTKEQGAYIFAKHTPMVEKPQASGSKSGGSLSKYQMA